MKLDALPKVIGRPAVYIPPLAHLISLTVEQTNLLMKR